MEVDKAFSKIQQPFPIEILRKIEGTTNTLTIVNIIKYQMYEIVVIQQIHCYYFYIQW